jgi:hypothetical protein
MIDETRKPRTTGVHLAALAWGASFFFIFAVYSLGFWYGAQLVAAGIPPRNGTVINGVFYGPGSVLPVESFFFFFFFFLFFETMQFLPLLFSGRSCGR